MIFDTQRVPNIYFKLFIVFQDGNISYSSKFWLSISVAARNVDQFAEIT
jgi:hypothetical protein